MEVKLPEVVPSGVVAVLAIGLPYVTGREEVNRPQATLTRILD
jgi:hypothetical protein